MKDWLEKHLSANLFEVSSWVHNLFGHLPAPAEAKKMLGFCEAQDQDDHPTSLYCLLLGGASSDAWADNDSCTSSPSDGMLSKKVSKLLSYAGVRSR